MWNADRLDLLFAIFMVLRTRRNSHVMEEISETKIFASYITNS